MASLMACSMIRSTCCIFSNGGRIATKALAKRQYRLCNAGNFSSTSTTNAWLSLAQ